jgi:hypothetical protein
MSSSTEFSAGFTGCTVVSDTNAKTGRYRGFVVNSDAIVSACLSGATNLMTPLGLTGVTLKQGIYISVSEDLVITSISLTSGSIVLYNE